MSIHSYNSGNPYNFNNRVIGVTRKKEEGVANQNPVKEEKIDVKQESSTQNSTKTEYGDNFSKEAFLVNNNIEIVPTGQETIQYTNDNPDVNGGEHNNGENPPSGDGKNGNNGNDGNNGDGNKGGGNDGGHNSLWTWADKRQKEFATQLQDANSHPGGEDEANAACFDFFLMGVVKGVADGWDWFTEH